MTKPYRADVVGSMLRPQYLLEARRAHASNQIPDEKLEQAENRAIEESIAIQAEAGMDVVTDGEMRRNVFASQLVQSGVGFARVEENWVDWYDMQGNLEPDPVTVAVVSKLQMERSFAADEFAYLDAKTDLPTKATLPSPSMYAYYWLPGVSEAAYPSGQAYLAHVTEILSGEVQKLTALGAEYIQIDAPEFGMLIDPHQREWFEAKGFEADRLIDDGVQMINDVIAGNKGVTFGLHVCRGNDKSRYMAKGGYDPIADRIFPKVSVERLLLEYDDERSGGFEPLQEVPEDKTVVLGLVTSKVPAELSESEIESRIEQATELIPLDRLALSTQCGFASVAEGNAISFDDQARKLRKVAEVARRVWED